jgi:hypothetical protein
MSSLSFPLFYLILSSVLLIVGFVADIYILKIIAGAKLGCAALLVLYSMRAIRKYTIDDSPVENNTNMNYILHYNVIYNPRGPQIVASISV